MGRIRGIPSCPRAGAVGALGAVALARLKLGLELTLPLARGLGLGEVVRYSIVRA